MKPYTLKVYDKQGFRNVTGNPILLLDTRGVVFYDTSNFDHKVYEFNLPAGTYVVIKGRFQPLAEPVKFSKIPLPEPERNRKLNPEHFEICFANNPNTCTVDWRSKQIIFDHRFREASLPAIMSIYYHELGHKYYETETFCDRYAYNKMIDAGYNPSQIGESFVLTLSEREPSQLRKTELVEAIIDDNSLNEDHTNFLPDHFDHVEPLLKGSGDMKFDTADDFIGGLLVALKTVNVYAAPNTNKLVRVVKPGERVGIIQSWIEPTKGIVWWWLTNGDYVKHETGMFNFDILKNSIIENERIFKSRVEAAAEKRKEENTSLLYNMGGTFFKNLNTVFAIIVLLAIIYLLNR